MKLSDQPPVSALLGSNFFRLDGANRPGLKIIITTIFPPTRALKKFVELAPNSVIVVGDKRTPAGWSLPEADFAAWDDPRFSQFFSSTHLPFNHYSRKNLGYLLAMQQKASSIIDTDDDNFPLGNFGFPAMMFSGDTFGSDLGFVNVYSQFTSKKIWPRGLPVRQINMEESGVSRSRAESRIGVWQGLANGDPDVDAIYRLTNNEPCIFNPREPLALAEGTWSPFNSQNTFFYRELFPLLYLPVTVSFRFTDILRSLVAQPIMWRNGFRLGFTEATVFQERNPHDYLEDLVSEFPMYRWTEAVAALLSNQKLTYNSILGGLLKSYEVLHQHEVVGDGELDSVSAWAQDCESFGFS